MDDSDERSDDTVQVVYALPDAQFFASVDLAPGMTAADAVSRSGLPEQFPEITAVPLVLGLFGRRIAASHLVRAGDRIEICRPLQLDPREMRRIMSSSGRVIGQRSAADDEGKD